MQIPFDNSYARLPERFFARLSPTPVAAPRLIRLNAALARDLRIDPDWLASPEGVEVLAGNRVPEGAEPLAQAYAGHQFGGFVPQLGDGRAILLGEVVGRDGRRRDIQLKGSGRTPFSRQGDGRAAIGPVLREYIVSEAMHALGIPTTRALAAVTTGEHVFREVVLPGAVLTRVAASHIRVGTFQYFAVRQDIEGLRTLADHAIARHHPAAAEAANPYLALLDAVVAAQAALVARWMLVGFIHGVMNTDNMAISGETIDYGPCAFMDVFDPATVFSSIDHGGRYAYGNQPHIAQWNLARLAETLLPLIDDDQDAAVATAMEMLQAFPDRFDRSWRAGMRAKLGLTEADDVTGALIDDFLALLHEQAVDFTSSFRALSAMLRGDAGSAQALFATPAAFDAWADRWRAQLAHQASDPHATADAMDRVNPMYIPRNDKVEDALGAAHGGDLEPFERLVDVLARPFDERPGLESYAAPAPTSFGPYVTFCGT
jgi:uncharacterized protein YdiU (UPF0061 family)